MDITAKTRLNDLLETYPQLEGKIIQAAPAFKNLQNPILRRTVGRLATVEKVVQMGGLNLTKFINLLRREVGQAELVQELAADQVELVNLNDEDPEWLHGEPQFVIDGTNLLASGEVPLNKINELLPQLSPGRFILLKTDFEPAPMIEAVTGQKRSAFHKLDASDPGTHLTYFL